MSLQLVRRGLNNVWLLKHWRVCYILILMVYQEHGKVGLMPQLKNVILTQSVESVPEWASCIRYAVTGKGKYGTRVPLLRQKILDSLMTSLPPTVATTVTTKRNAFLAAVLIEISPQKMLVSEINLHNTLLKEVLGNMHHSSAQVREALGVSLSVLYSNIRLYHSSHQDQISDTIDSLMMLDIKLCLC
ncbi:proteasome activator subunit 4-like [Vigna radiata var. radiata]|uniref:Proteasome activator subunit 4-like n=1 Tax=Vigna radiata var. radiata TaxID=3916 RepID=A0A3Q0EW73_VIGRR|nr:proteasome activator subunit 4-like [Vigna radiata var. radiata]